LFAQDIGGRIRLNPLVLAFPSGPRASLEPREAIPLEIEVFGTFRVRVGGQEIRFARRRDRNIVEFLALRRDGKASRTELLETFWPGGDRGLARQGLRTACSMIRRAFGACVGEERVSAYFEADAAAVVLRSESTGNRYLQFVEQVERAREAERSGAPEAAERSWSAAAALYTGPLLAGEELAMPWVAQAARAADAMAAEARRRIGG
jgi:DNA-binding SARP family transcriptional activator